mgnify:CR=1 FL=1
MPMTTFPERFKARRDELGLSQSDIAVSLGIKPQSVHQWEHGTTMPRGHRMAELATLLSTSPEWLVFDISTNDRIRPVVSEETGGTKESGLFSDTSLSSSPLGQVTPESTLLIDVPVYDVSFAAGDGSYVEEDLIVDNFPIAAKILEQHQVSPDYAAVVTVKGDSMNTGLHDGDMVLLNTFIKKPISNKIFAFAYDEDLKVKRFNRQFDNNWLVTSDNEDKNLYRDLTVSLYNIEQLRIIGQVVTIVSRSLL